ncbi:MAG: PDZ domain-containing protein [Candidatus Hydrogenedentes bacterium]|nr:PDZ domain-containing protein [Candidatus Hydrogenedentota bacterium]
MKVKYKSFPDTAKACGSMLLAVLLSAAWWPLRAPAQQIPAPPAATLPPAPQKAEKPVEKPAPVPPAVPDPAVPAGAAPKPASKPDKPVSSDSAAVPSAEKVPTSNYTAVTTLIFGRHLVPVAINGAEPCAFVLDASIQRVVLDPAVCFESQTEPENNPPDATGIQAADVELAFAGMPPFTTPAVLADLSGLSATLGTAVHGLLPLYQPGFEVSLQWSPSSVEWRSLELARLPTEDQAVPIQVGTDGGIRMPFLLNGASEITCTVDLAYNGMISMNSADIPANAEAAGEYRMGYPDGSMDYYLRYASCRTGGLTVVDPVVEVLEGAAPALAGIQFFSFGRLTINFEHGLALVEGAQGKQVQRTPIEGYGLQPIWNGVDWFLAVVAGGPGGEAGLLPGDRLVAVNGEEVFNIDPEVLVGLFDVRRGNRIALVAERGGEYEEFYLEARVLF